MSDSSSQQASREEAASTGKRQPTGDYEVGYCRTPKHTRFKPGHKSCGGRRRGSLNVRTLYDRAMKMKVLVRKGNKTVKMPAMEAMLANHTIKAVNGDHRSLGKVIDFGTKLQYFKAEDESGENTAPMQPPVKKLRPSDELIESVDCTLLDRQEQAELAKLAELIDGGGNVIALSAADIVRLKQLIAKGRGKDAMPQGDEPLDEAA